jgi:tetratricopeptide (TPR) repeat protein
MEEATAASAVAPENTAYVTTLTANLLVLTGKRADARTAYEHALDILPGYAAAIAGLGRLAVGDGDLTVAIAQFKRASEILPLPEYVIALGDAQQAAGDQTGAKDSYDLARLETTLFQSNGVVVDLELALFEADHGDPVTALSLAERAYAERHTFRTADALAWALLRADRPTEARARSLEALQVGTRDPLVLYHAGMIASRAGETVEAQRLLRQALMLDAGFSATGATAARAELARLADAP